VSEEGLVTCAVWYGDLEPKYARFSRVPFVGELVHVYDLPPLVVLSVAHEQHGRAATPVARIPIAASLACKMSDGTPDDTRPLHSLHEGVLELLRRVPTRGKR
jgi:hypothetical protein